MLIQSRTIVGAAGALAIVGAALWGSSLLRGPDAQSSGQVEVQQVIERSWAVEVKDLATEPAIDATKTAAVTR